MNVIEAERLILRNFVDADIEEMLSSIKLKRDGKLIPSLFNYNLVVYFMASVIWPIAV